MVPLRRRAFKRRGQRSPQSWLPFTVVLVVTAFNTKFAFSLEVTHFFYYCADRQKLAPSFLFFSLWLDFTLLWGTTKGKKVEARCQQSMNSRGQTSDCKKQRQKGKERKKGKSEQRQQIGANRCRCRCQFVWPWFAERALQVAAAADVQFSSVLALTGSDLKSEFEAIVRLRPKHG